jgi:hypothetical protein
MNTGVAASLGTAAESLDLRRSYQSRRVLAMILMLAAAASACRYATNERLPAWRLIRSRLATSE